MHEWNVNDPTLSLQRDILVLNPKVDPLPATTAQRETSLTPNRTYIMPVMSPIELLFPI